VIVIEDRAEFAPYFEGTKYVVCEPPLYEEAGVSSSDYIVICTRGHSTDEQALRFGLSKKPRYIGMIGSKNKVSLLMRKLLDDGFSPEDLKNVYTPIGLDIASALPAEIAVSILAEILLVKNKGTPHHKKTGME
jgi:xanthine dehydrogenase accessory factor